MSEFGLHLKQAREERGISLRQIATTTKISMAALEALERADFSRLPGGIFSRAFVRAYAIEVGLDPDQTVQEFLNEYERYDTERAERVPRPEVTADDRAFAERQRRAAQALRGILIGLVVLGVAAFFVWQMKVRSRSTTPPDTASGSIAASRPGTPSDQPPPAAVETPPAATPLAAPTIGEAAKSASDTSQFAIHLEATQDCWVRVTADGAVQVEQILHAGDRRDVKASREMYLQVGNAGAITWTLNGQPAKDLGKAGQPGTARVTPATLTKYLR
jgi:cytoskeleton protein RodZ